MDELIVELGVTDQLRLKVNSAVCQQLWPGNHVGIVMEYLAGERLLRIRRHNASGVALHKDNWKRDFWVAQFCTTIGENTKNCRLLPRMGLTRLEVVRAVGATIVCRLPDELRPVKRSSPRVRRKIHVY